MGFFKKIIFDVRADRIGPDIPFTHWRLHFKSQMRKLCKKKFFHFGDRSEFRPFAYAINCSKISIGNDVVIRSGTMLFADTRLNEPVIIIEDKVLIGSGVHFYVSNHKFSDNSIPIFDQGHEMPEKIVVEKGAWIGANAILLPGVKIGANSIIGAGSVVTKSIPPRVVAAGNPARIIKEL